LGFNTFIHGNVIIKLLYSCLKQTKMSFSKSGEKEGKIGPVWKLVPVGGGRRTNVVEILCTHVCK
jgi:hypothetical protein